VSHAPYGEQNYRGKNTTDNKSSRYGIPISILNISGQNNAAVGHNGTDAETSQFFGRGKRNARIKIKDLKDDDKDRQIGPVGYKGLGIDTAVIMDKAVNSDPKETPCERKQNSQKVGDDKGCMSE
jgi:hypothetical protein